MDDLVRWLGEQLDEDERIARAATGEEWGAVAPPQPYVIFDVAEFGANKTLETVGRLAAVERDEDRAHIARHDPARVLREIDSKRRIAELHDYYRSESLGNAPACFLCGPGFGWPCPTMRSLALPYADQPGYREEWRP